MDKTGTACDKHGEDKCTQGFGGHNRKKEKLAIHICKQEDHFKICFKEIGWAGMYWIHLAQETVESGGLLD